MKMKTLLFLLTIFIQIKTFGQQDSISEKKLPDCAHSHNCCQVDCPCCPNFGKIDFHPNFPSVQDNPLYSLIGKEIFGHEAIDFISTLGSQVTVSIENISHLQYFADGVEIVYDLYNGKILAVFLLAPNSNDAYQPYSGELPFRLNWNMTKNEVESLLGKSEMRQLMSDVYYQYKIHKIEIDFFENSESPKMKTIQIRNFD